MPITGTKIEHEGPEAHLIVCYHLHWYAGKKKSRKCKKYTGLLILLLFHQILLPQNCIKF